MARIAVLIRAARFEPLEALRLLIATAPALALIGAGPALPF